MNKCKHLKLKFNHTIYCTKLNKEIQLKKCTNCKHKEYQKKVPILIKNRTKIKKNGGIKKKSAKLSKLERNRFSVLTNDLDHCILCGLKKDNLHEIYQGRNRPNSMKYGLVLPLCIYHHRLIHSDINLQEYYHKLGQQRFMEYYRKSKEDFRKIFYRNYL